MRDVMNAIIEMYNFKMSAPLLRMYDAALSKYDIDAIEQAFGEHISDPVKSKFAPKPGDLILYIAGTKRDRAGNAADKLQLAIRKTTAHTGVTFDDALINLTIQQLGGWVSCYYSVCEAEKSHEYIAQFVKTYERLSIAGATHHSSYLPGRADDGSFVPVGDAAGVRDVVLSGYDPKRPQLTQRSAVQIRHNS